MPIWLLSFLIALGMVVAQSFIALLAASSVLRSGDPPGGASA